jgi:predicted DNA-binding transcriptional regulator AlpA
MSKYQAYTYLNMSRATFDNLVREGKLPKGVKVAGFKELFWYKKDLDKALT